MKEFKMYQCEVCGATYTNRVTAVSCEENHHMPIKTHYEYVSRTKENTGYPKSVQVEFDNGHNITYVMKRID